MSKPQWEKDIDDDLAWRMDELAFLKVRVALETDDTVGHRALLRALVALLYAHYEGFCINTLNLYLEEIEKVGTPRHECHAKLREFSLNKSFRQLRGDTSSNNLFKFFTADLLLLMNQAVEFVRDQKHGGYELRGKSNLYADDLGSACENVALSRAAVDNNALRIDLLVNRRNQIAHGQKEVIKDLQMYQQFEDAAMEVMHDLALNVIESLHNKSFLLLHTEFLI